MRDVYCESIVKRDDGTAGAVKKFAVWLLAVLISLVVLYFSLVIPMLITLFPIVLAGALWMAYNITRNMNLEYEYAVTGGDMDIDKIMGRRKRKRVVSVQTSSFKILAPYSEGWKNEYSSDTIGKIIDVSASSNAPGNWFAKFENDGVTTLLIFTPNEKLLGGLAVTCSRIIQGYDG